MGNNILTKELLLKSVEEWNAAREAYPDLKPDLREAYLCGSNLRHANLIMADLHKANLSGADLTHAILFGADLSWADLSEAELCHAYLRAANLSWATLNDSNMSEVDLLNADLRRALLLGAYDKHANLCDADLIETNFIGVNLSRACLSGATLSGTVFGAVDLSSIIGLDAIRHSGPSTIGIDTIYASNGEIPDVFLRGCGVPDAFIKSIRELKPKASDYYSCFISHSTTDKVFVDRLYENLKAKGVTCYNASYDMEGGEYVDIQLERAINNHEKVLLLLSESSIQ